MVHSSIHFGISTSWVQNWGKICLLLKINLLDNDFDKLKSRLKSCYIYQGFSDIMWPILKIKPLLYPWGGSPDTTIVPGIVCYIVLFLIHHSTGKQTWPQHIVYNFWFGFHRICFRKHLKNNLFLKTRIFS